MMAVQLRQPSSAGFTLLEVLIAISLVALIMLVLFSSLRTGAKTWEAGERQAEEITDMRVVLDFLRRQLRQAQVVHHSKDGEIRVVFAGEERSIRFVTPIMPHLQQGGLRMIEISAEEPSTSGKASSLKVRLAPYRPDQAQEMPEDAAERELLSDVTELEYRFFGVLEDEDEPAWHAEWKDAPAMPEMVSVIIRTEKRPWPPLYVDLPH